MIRWVLSLFTILVVAILVLGWPTLYRYDSLHDGKDITVYRTNRFTGSVAKLTDD
jgi:membrane protein implicated in regulation of membrane protease activity